MRWKSIKTWSRNSCSLLAVPRQVLHPVNDVRESVLRHCRKSVGKFELHILNYLESMEVDCYVHEALQPTWCSSRSNIRWNNGGTMWK